MGVGDAHSFPVHEAQQPVAAVAGRAGGDRPRDCRRRSGVGRINGIGRRRSTFQDIRYRECDNFGILHFDFMNGAMSARNCERLLAAYRHAQARPTHAIMLCGDTDFSTAMRKRNWRRCGEISLAPIAAITKHVGVSSGNRPRNPMILIRRCEPGTAYGRAPVGGDRGLGPRSAGATADGERGGSRNREAPGGARTRLLPRQLRSRSMRPAFYGLSRLKVATSRPRAASPDMTARKIQ